MFAQQHNRQLGIEGYIASSTMLLFAGSFLATTEIVGRVQSSPTRHMLGFMFLWLCGICFVALTFFQMLKMPSYMHGTTLYNTVLTPLYVIMNTLISGGETIQ